MTKKHLAERPRLDDVVAFVRALPEGRCVAVGVQAGWYAAERRSSSTDPGDTGCEIEIDLEFCVRQAMAASAQGAEDVPDGVVRSHLPDQAQVKATCQRLFRWFDESFEDARLVLGRRRKKTRLALHSDGDGGGLAGMLESAMQRASQRARPPGSVIAAAVGGAQEATLAPGYRPEVRRSPATVRAAVAPLPDLETRVREAASRCGRSVDEWKARAFERQLEEERRRDALLRLGSLEAPTADIDGMLLEIDAGRAA